MQGLLCVAWTPQGLLERNELRLNRKEQGWDPKGLFSQETGEGAQFVLRIAPLQLAQQVCWKDSQRVSRKLSQGLSHLRAATLQSCPPLRYPVKFHYNFGDDAEKPILILCGFMGAGERRQCSPIREYPKVQFMNKLMCAVIYGSGD